MYTLDIFILFSLYVDDMRSKGFEGTAADQSYGIMDFHSQLLEVCLRV